MPDEPIQILTFVLPPLETNCYIVAHPRTGDSVIIDPGTPTPELEAAAISTDRRVHAILVTHGHIDHIAGAARLKHLTGAPLFIHPDEAPMLEDPARNGALWLGLPFTPCRTDRLIEPAGRLEFGALSFQILACPGHSPGHVAFLTGKYLFAGDFVFRGSIGRTDLPGANPYKMAASLRRAFLPLPDDVVIYSGHGEPTTVGEEKHHNEIIQRMLEEFAP
ncbi:MAG: MBL fold metallo-hydrolase [Candidatus Sumerlaeia bacterium]